jgi:hypothetical protein
MGVAMRTEQALGESLTAAYPGQTEPETEAARQRLLAGARGGRRPILRFIGKRSAGRRDGLRSKPGLLADSMRVRR